MVRLAVARLERVADAAGGDGALGVADRADGAAFEAMPRADFAHDLRVAAACAAEREVVARHDAGRAHVAHQHFLNPMVGGHRRHRRIEVQHQHGVGAGGGEQLLPLVERGEAERLGVGLEVADRVRIEGGDDGRAALGLCPADRLAHDGLVALVEPVEVAERQNGAAHRFGNGFAVVETNHVRSGL
jgi:hypothetical protein